MKKIFFLLFSKNIEGKEFALKETNPGVGGTQFTTINTALGLGLFVPDWQIILVNYSPVNIKDPPANLEQVFYDTPQDFFKQYSQNSSSLIVATVAIISQVPITLIQPLSECLILWSHHPFDLGLKNILKSISIKAVVCPGIYQSFSNQTLTSKICHIQNIFTLPTIDHFPADHSLNRKQINLVHLSALGPAKGFLDIAKSWQPLKTRFPNIKLHVIGSSATYGQESESTIVPTSSDFATQILKFIPQEDIAAGHVIFYGNLGREKFDIMRECDLAILNPKGYTEAFPASPLEMFACGVPVIASDDYGMSDCMRFFPELIIN
ncbi:MAG: glycosyltransferase, partial [Xenococcus sp. (in: cyanobacteria)]